MTQRVNSIYPRPPVEFEQLLEQTETCLAELVAKILSESALAITPILDTIAPWKVFPTWHSLIIRGSYQRENQLCLSQI